MLYLFNYEYLNDKLMEHYKTTTYNKMLVELAKAIHRNVFYLKRILINKTSFFLQNEICTISKILNLSSDDIVKCFFTYEKEVNYMYELTDYLKDNKKSEN